MLNILIIGALGKMGKKVKNACDLNDGFLAVAGVDKTSDFSNSDFPVYEDIYKVKEKFDAIIDFSSPLSLPNTLKFIQENKIPAVLCSTGYSEEDIKSIKKASEKTAIFRSANMSLGVNVLISAVKETAKKLYGFDIEIIEKHHNEKKDAPSGTAIMIADAIKNELPEKFFTYGRNGMVGKRNQNEIGIHAVRGGNIVGEHEVLFAGLNESLTFKHEAFDRAVFAEGAVKASKYISTKTNGLFDMSDMLSGK